MKWIPHWERPNMVSKRFQHEFLATLMTNQPPQQQPSNPTNPTIPQQPTTQVQPRSTHPTRGSIPSCAKLHGVLGAQTAGHVVDGECHVVPHARTLLHIEVTPRNSRGRMSSTMRRFMMRMVVVYDWSGIGLMIYVVIEVG